MFRQLLNTLLLYAYTHMKGSEMFTLNIGKVQISDVRLAHYDLALAMVASMKGANNDIGECVLKLIGKARYSDAGKAIAAEYGGLNKLAELDPAELAAYVQDMRESTANWLKQQAIDKATESQGKARKNEPMNRVESRDSLIASVDMPSDRNVALRALKSRKATSSYAVLFGKMTESQLVAIADQYDSLSADGKREYRNGLKAHNLSLQDAQDAYAAWQSSMKAPAQGKVRPYKASAESSENDRLAKLESRFNDIESALAMIANKL